MPPVSNSVPFGTPTKILDHLLDEPEAVYAARRADHLSSHSLAEFRRNPRLYRKKQLGLVQDQDRPSYAVGRAVHCRILEGTEEFARRFAVGGPINPKTGRSFGCDTKAYQEWLQAQGRPAVTDEVAALCESLAQAVQVHDAARELLAAGRAEGVARGDYGGFPCQARLDWVHPEQGIVDLKTIDNLDYFEMQARSFDYVHQLAFYRGVLMAVSGISVPVHFIAVEKQEPFRVGVWFVTGQILDAAERENLAAMRRLEHCRQTDSWPTGYEQIRTFDYI